MKSPSRTPTHDSTDDHSFDNSHHPIWAIANAVATFFLIAVAISFLVMLTDAFISHT